MNRWEGAFRPLLSAAATCSRGSLPGPRSVPLLISKYSLSASSTPLRTIVAGTSRVMHSPVLEFSTTCFIMPRGWCKPLGVKSG